MIVYGLWAAGAFTIGVGLLPVVCARGARPPDAASSGRASCAPSSRSPAPRVLAFGFYTAVKAAYLSTVFSTVVEERNLIYLAPLCFVATALALERGRLRWWALAATTGFVLYVILTTPYQLDLWPYADALGFGIVQMANRDLAFDDGDVKLLLVVVLVVSHRPAPRAAARRAAGGTLGSGSRSPRARSCSPGTSPARSRPRTA